MMSEVETSDECVPELNNPAIICEKCHLSFTRKSSFYRHMRKFHREEDLNITRSKVCGICNEKVRTLLLLHEHIPAKHDVSLQFTEEMFYCEDDFLKWKSEIEREGQANFVQERGCRDSKQEGVKLRCYVCHRSGFPAAKEQDSKRKRSGSIKIGFTCPASIHVVSETVDGISCIKVKYQSVHVGHDLGVKLRLSKEDKARLASSLKAGVSISNLLKELRENYAPSHPYRQITRKDLHNISRDFKLSKTRSLQRDDLATVDFVVKKIHCSDLQTALLVYKPVGDTLPGYPALNKNDFLLGIMNDVQEKLLEIYGNACIMIDSSGSKDNFYLSTIMVRDENNESLPVATFFSSKTSVEVLQPFFDAILRRLPQLKTKTIMSDDLTSFFNAWQKVFKDESQHLLCSWYVLRNLFRNIELKVKNENRKAMKSYLKTFLKEQDIATFEFMMKTFIEQYEVEEKDFITYFRTHYEPRAQKWAYCYRIAQGINPDMRLERWRNQLKLDEKGTENKRLDKTLFVVNSAIATKLISNAIVMDMDKLSARILLCQKLHEESFNQEDQYNVVDISDSKCTIAEVENGKTFSHVIKKLREVCGCDIRCQTCNICIHSMSCTCVDYCVHFAICKHMHRFCSSFAPALATTTQETITQRVITHQGSEESFNSCDNEPVHPMETEDVESQTEPVESLTEPVESLTEPIESLMEPIESQTESIESQTEPIADLQCTIDGMKARVKAQLHVLEKMIDGVNNMEVIKNVEEYMTSISSYLIDAVPSCSFSNEISGS